MDWSAEAKMNYGLKLKALHVYKSLQIGHSELEWYMT